MEQLREVAKFLDKEIQRYSREVYQEMRSDAPQTTPDISNFEIWFGRSRYKAVVTNVMDLNREMNHVDFLEAIMSTYLKDQTPIQLQGYQEKEDVRIAQLSWSNLGTVKGEQDPGQDVIWMQFLPKRAAENIGNKIAANFNSKIAQALRDFPLKYSKRNFYSAGSADRNEFKEVFSHELTHFYATSRTKLGDLQRKGAGYYEKSIAQLGPAEFAQYIDESEKRKNMQDQASSIGSNASISGIEEVFAHFIGFQYLRKRREVASSYERDRYIQWGINILYEKLSSENPSRPIDWARAEMKKVFEDIARTGQIQTNGERKDVFVLFLKRMMPTQDRKRMNYMRQITEGDLAKAFSDFKSAIEDVEGAERKLGNKEVFRDFKKLEENVDWSNPREIEDIVLHRVLEKAVGGLSLSETEELLRNEIEKEVEQLETIIDKGKGLESEVPSEDLDQEFVNSLKELKQAENELAQLN